MVPCLIFSGALPSVEAEWLRAAERLQDQAGERGEEEGVEVTQLVQTDKASKVPKDC